MWDAHFPGQIFTLIDFVAASSLRYLVSQRREAHLCNICKVFDLSIGAVIR